MIYHMSDWREAGNAAFRGPRILIGPFLPDRSGRPVQGQANYRCDIFPDALYLEIVRSPPASELINGADGRQAPARPGVDVATPENPLGPRRAGEAGVIGADAAIANTVVNTLGSDGDSVTRLPLRPQEVVAAFPVEVGE
jgi:CO/xanthine dehydrogenase Mo-binding subunit